MAIRQAGSKKYIATINTPKGIVKLYVDSPQEAELEAKFIHPDAKVVSLEENK